MKYSENIEFHGNSLKYEPLLLRGEDTYVRFVLDSGVHILFKYDSDYKDLLPYLYSYEGKITFASKEVEEDFRKKTPNISISEDKEGVFSRLWKGIMNLTNKVKDFIQGLF